MSKNSGFTVAELMVVIGLIAIISAIAIPNLVGWRHKYRLGNASSAMLSGIEHARLTAIKENASVGVAFDDAANSYSLWLDNGEGGGTENDIIQNGAEQNVSHPIIPQGIDMVSASFGADSKFRFNARGIPLKADTTPGGGAVLLRNIKGETRSIVVSNGGNVKIQ